MTDPVKKIAFPRYAEYNCAIKYLVETGLDAKCILQPEITKRTIDIGSKYSPDFVCTPFKTTLGSMIEALEAGADTIAMTYGACRLGYYGELQEQILRDLGYKFDFVNLTEYDTGKKKDFIRGIKRLSPRAKLPKFALRLIEAIHMVEYLDEVTAEYYQNCGFDPTGRAYRQAYQKFLTAMYTAGNKADIESGYRQVKQEFRQIPLEKPERPLRVGVMGEFYTAMDAFSNLVAVQ